MKLSKNIIAPALALGILIPTGVYLASEAKADDTDGRTSIIEKIATRFNLNQDEVQQVFDEHREERREARRSMIEEKLNQAVTDGKITEAQKQLLLDKKEEMMNEHQGKMEEFRNLSQEEKREKMQEHRGEFQAHREEFKTWAEENGIDLDELRGYFGGFGFKGHHRGGMWR